MAASSCTSSCISCVIVGGGVAGISVAKKLLNRNNRGTIEVTVVDKNNYLDWSVASARSLVSPDDVEKYGWIMPLDKVAAFVGFKFVHSAVEEISEKAVRLTSGNVLEANFIVVAIGGYYKNTDLFKPHSNNVITYEQRLMLFRSEQERIKSPSVKSIVVVGAGLAGVEVAGEIKSAFPSKKVTLVGSFLPSTSESMRSQTKAELEKMGVVITKGMIKETNPVDGKVKTIEGETLDADIMFHCAGFIFNAGDFMKENLKGDVTDRGQLNCRTTLQLASSDCIFACGDIVAVPFGCYGDCKGSVQAENMGTLVANNIANLAEGKKLDSFKWSNTPVTSPVMTVLSPNIGLTDLGFLPRFMNFAQNFICRKLKCQDYFMSLHGKSYGKGTTW